MRHLLLTISLAIYLSNWSSPQEPEPSYIILLNKTFSDIPIIWQEDEPFAQAGDWLKALQLKYHLREDGIHLEAPNKIAFFWSKEANYINVKDRIVEVTPLQQQDGYFWIPIHSLARLLGLEAIVNAEKYVVKLTSPLKGIEARQNDGSWLVTLTFGYPLPEFPKTATLRQPDRAYADFFGAVLKQVELPEIKDGSLLKGFRLGQFSNEPAIVRFVADVLEPVTIRLAGREISEKGFEKWHLLIQPASKPNQWLGQIFIKENEPKRAVVLILGWLEGGLNLSQSAKIVTVSLPEKPLFGSDLSLSNDGILESVALETEVSGTKLTISLRE
ncbi:MAG: hypothetical protein NZ805_07665, partial [Armatimonadetes bacterium]|nr:hypothetical protein [Armatimonadota bacterium]MDW8029450.1 hypothetical protein [Armatimonadota bacterium]